MKVLVCGGSGRLGRLVVEYLLRKEADVSVLARTARVSTSLRLSLPGLPPGASIRLGDVLDPADVAAAARDCDAVVATLAPPVGTPRFAEKHAALVASVLRGCREGGAARVLVAGGAAAMPVRGSGGRPARDVFPVSLVSSFSGSYRSMAAAHEASLRLLRGLPDIPEWTYFAPGLMHAAPRGAPTQDPPYEVVADELPTASAAFLSAYEDVADAMVAELLAPRFPGRAVGVVTREGFAAQALSNVMRKAVWPALRDRGKEQDWAMRAAEDRAQEERGR